MNKLAFAAVSVAILATAVCALPWYLGLQTEQAMRAEVSKMAGSAPFPLNVTFMRYDRGWLSSAAVTRLTLKAEPSIYLDVRHEISQLPRPGAGWVHVRSVPQWNGQIKTTLDHYFAGQPALIVESVVGFDGSRKTTFSSPAFSQPLREAPGAKLTWGGMEGTVSVGPDKRMVASASAPHLTLQGDDTQAGLKSLKLDAAWEMRGPVADWQGETRVALAEFRLSGPRDQVAMKDLSGEAYQRSKGDNVLLGYALRVGAGSSAKAGEPENSFSNAVLDLEFDQINKKALAKYLDDVGVREQLATAPLGTYASQTMMDLAAELLRGSPVIRLKKLGVETPSGAVSAQAIVSFDGSNLAEIRLSPELLGRLQAKGIVEIAASLLRSQLQRKVRPQVEVALVQQGAQSTEENIKAVSEKLTDAQLKSLTDTGLLRPSGTNFIVEAEFVAGQVRVNGQPASQLFGTILAPPPALERPARALRPDVQAEVIPSRPVSLAQRSTPSPLVPSAR
jgi:uncharacterized protein YdgA (DUF945 family)